MRHQVSVCNYVLYDSINLKDFLNYLIKVKGILTRLSRDKYPIYLSALSYITSLTPEARGDSNNAEEHFSPRLLGISEEDADATDLPDHSHKRVLCNQ